MFRAPNRGRRRLRLVRTRAVRRLCQAVADATHGLLRQLRRRAHARRPGDGIDLAEEPAKRAGQRALLVSVRRAFGGGRSRRVFLFAVTVPDLVLRRMQCRLRCIGNLVWPDRGEEILNQPRELFLQENDFIAVRLREMDDFAGGSLPGKKLRRHELQGVVAPDQIRRRDFLESGGGQK